MIAGASKCVRLIFAQGFLVNMCGFVGFISSVKIGTSEEIHSEKTEKERIISAMNERIKHRGPDQQGIYVGKDIALGFRRLSLVDHENGLQPLISSDGNLALVFNGEIYNYRELTKTLTEKGHNFKTNTDGECIIHLFEQYGSKALSYLRGMFAFAVYNKETGTLFAARDHFGIKPFYYGVFNSTLIFASEIKAFFEHPDFSPVLNEAALQQYLTFQYSPLPETFFKGVFKLLPGRSMIYANGNIEFERYFTPKFDPDPNPTEHSIREIDHAIGDSIERHTTADFEIGAFLSGGVDSSLIAARFGGRKVFSVGFEQEKYNETENAAELAEKLGLEHYIKIITPEEYWNAVSDSMYHLDEPVADASIIAVYFLSKLAKERVKSVLSGEGADELFGGYAIYREPYDLRSVARLPRALKRGLGNFAKKIPFNIKGKNFFIRGSKSLEDRFFGNAHIFSFEERKALLNISAGADPRTITEPVYREISPADDITKMQQLDIRMWLVGDILQKADKMSMAHGLEIRTPYLDKEVFKVAARLPTSMRVNKKFTKFAFRRAAAKHLPEANSKRKKLGFPTPIRIWLKDEKYAKHVADYFSSDVAKKFFKTEILLKLLKEHKNGRRDHSRKIWTAFVFLIWYEVFFDKKMFKPFEAQTEIEGEIEMKKENEALEANDKD